MVKDPVKFEHQKTSTVEAMGFNEDEYSARTKELISSVSGQKSTSEALVAVAKKVKEDYFEQRGVELSRYDVEMLMIGFELGKSATITQLTRDPRAMMGIILAAGIGSISMDCDHDQDEDK